MTRTLKAFRRPMNILQRAQRLLKAKAIHKPVWYDAVSAYPPDLPPRYAPPPPRVQYPEDRLLRNFFAKNPLARKHQVFNLFNQEEKPPAVKFVLRQLELMNGKDKLSEAAAYKQTCDEMKNEEVLAGLSNSKTDIFGQPKVDQTRSLAEAFDDWMAAEGSFWRQRAEYVQEVSKRRKNKKT